MVEPYEPTPLKIPNLGVAAWAMSMVTAGVALALYPVPAVVVLVFSAGIACGSLYRHGLHLAWCNRRFGPLLAPSARVQLTYLREIVPLELNDAQNEAPFPVERLRLALSLTHALQSTGLSARECQAVGTLFLHGLMCKAMREAELKALQDGGTERPGSESGGGAAT